MEKFDYPQNVIIDSDMGLDDILAILCLVKNPNVNLLGITVTGCGETHLKHGCYIALSLLQLANIDAPVCAGAKIPSSSYNNQFPASFRNAMDTVCGLINILPKPKSDVDRRPAWEFIKDSLEEQENQISILSLGGLTNIARLIEMQPTPQLLNIEEIVIMGGAVNVDGNIASLNNAKPEWNQGPTYATNVYAEWNLFIDVFAAKKVINSNIPLTFVPLDVCNHVMLTADYADLVTAKDAVAKVAKQLLLKAKSDPHNPGCEPIPEPVFDPLAAMVMARMLRSYRTTTHEVAIETIQTDVDNTCGQLYQVENSGNRPVRIVTTVSAIEFRKAFTETIDAPLKPVVNSIIKKVIGILIFQDVEVQDLAGVYQVFAACRNCDNTAVYNVVTIASDTNPKKVNAGAPPQGEQSNLSITPDYNFENHPPLDALVIIGGQGIDALLADKELSEVYKSFIKNIATDVERIASVCSGGLLLASTGLVKDMDATTHHSRFEQLRDLSEKMELNLNVVDTRNGLNYVHKPNSKFMMAGGVHCCIALAVYMIGQDLGNDAKMGIATDVLEYTIPVGRNVGW